MTSDDMKHLTSIELRVPHLIILTSSKGGSVEISMNVSTKQPLTPVGMVGPVCLVGPMGLFFSQLLLFNLSNLTVTHILLSALSE